MCTKICFVFLEHSSLHRAIKLCGTKKQIMRALILMPGTDVSRSKLRFHNEDESCTQLSSLSVYIFVGKLM